MPTSPVVGEEQPEWVDLDSGSIASAAFLGNKVKNGDLLVRFTSGAEYSYADVRYDQYKTLLYTGSAGNYLRKEIIPHHEGTRLKPGTTKPAGPPV